MRSCGKITKTGLTILLMAGFLVTGTWSCSSKVNVEGFDAKGWQSDTNGCRKERSLLLPALLQHKQELMDKKDERVMEYLGKPDLTLFFARGKKTFIYRIDPGERCLEPKAPGLRRSLRFDVNALGRIELVYVIRE